LTPTTGTRVYRRRLAPIAILVAATSTTGLRWVVESWWQPFPDPVELQIYLWIGAGVLAALLLTARGVSDRRIWRGLVSVCAAAAVLAAAAVSVNSVFAAYPTVGDAFGIPAAEKIALDQIPPGSPTPVTGTPLESVWQPPAGMPTNGRVTSAPIPGTVSGFQARNAQIYLPPAYFAEPRPLLPVLVLLAGQPGAPEDWLSGGRLPETMDAFAAGHDGLTPLVVIADGTGSQLANPLCLDSRLGNVATYLTMDVPAWVKSNLQVTGDPRSWAIGGLSYGGTCALQMATNYPHVYPTFLDLSGQLEPTLGDRTRTVAEAFGGDGARLAAVNPMDLMTTRRYPGTAGVFVIGRDDSEYTPGGGQAYEAAKKAGMDVHYVELPGGHSFAVWSAGLAHELDWLTRRLGLTG
ncbi:alpha/beta hydrolase, partial [Rhodococcus jostii]|uniref:alpha/beta hydrolase n=1 Tax=Rhodococcus jostii TaxID=132919 RepID=UPI00363514F1